MLLSAAAAAAQTGERVDTTEDDSWNEDWTLDSLDPDDFAFDSEEQIYHLSRGWFPTPNRGSSLSLTTEFLYVDVHDRATDLRSSAIVPTTEPFTWHNPYRCGFFSYLIDNLMGGGGCTERTIRAVSDGEELDELYPESGFDEFGLRFVHNFRFPVMLRAEGYYRQFKGILFSEDTSRAYLSFDGAPRSFREIGVLTHTQYSVAGSIGLQIPFYGVFLDSDFGRLGSYYYVYGGVGGGYAVVSRTTQYAQIADAKDEIRYGNGQDTVTLMHTNDAEGIGRLRTSIETALGWGLTAEFFTLGFEAFLSIPTRSMLEDAEWREYAAGLRFSVGYAWGMEASK
jgi:hypothetical protein